jgi:hypothetical protein
MKLSRSLTGCLVLLVASHGASAATSPAGSASVKKASGNKAAASIPTAAPENKTPAPIAAPPAPASLPSPLKLEDYLDVLKDALKLTDLEQKEIEADYVKDGAQLKDILNNDALSPLQQAGEVSDLRDARDAKIQGLLDDWGRQREFLRIEAKYRVALTELAADGGMVAAPPSAQPDKTPAGNAPPK